MNRWWRRETQNSPKEQDRMTRYVRLILLHDNAPAHHSAVVRNICRRTILKLYRTLHIVLIYHPVTFGWIHILMGTCEAGGLKRAVSSAAHYTSAQIVYKKKCSEKHYATGWFAWKSMLRWAASTSGDSTSHL